MQAPPGLRADDLLPIMARDKKSGGGLTFVLDGPSGIERVDSPEIVATCKAPCLGYSMIKHESVTEIIMGALPITASLALAAFCLWMVVGIVGGIVAALNRGRWPDRTIVGLALVGFSLPTFFIGLLLLTFVAIKWQLVPVPTYTPFTENPFLWAQGLVLPGDHAWPASSPPRTFGSPGPTCSRR